jgi:CheY-like chemotaxis protein
MRVLIVDDQTSGRAALSALLRGRGDIERVDAVRLGSEVFTKLREEAYDVVLLDLNAPEGRVCALLEVLRAIPDRVPSLMFVQAQGAVPALDGRAPRRVSSPQIGAPGS